MSRAWFSGMETPPPINTLDLGVQNLLPLKARQCLGERASEDQSLLHMPEKLG